MLIQISYKLQDEYIVHTCITPCHDRNVYTVPLGFL